MKKFLLPLCLAFAATPALAQAPTPPDAQTPTPLDGEWRGRSDGGSCNAPLEYVIYIESGLVEGSATDATARGPVPNTKKGPPPEPTPGLWQIHGLAKPGSFSLIAVASVKATDRRQGRLNVTSQGGTLTITEISGCGRTARLSRG
jgi:hypothetical protein